MALSDLAVRQAKATGKAYTVADTDGLSLAVPPTGGKTWHFRYCWATKQKRMSLGTYPEVALQEARVRRNDARALLAKGINPVFAAGGVHACAQHRYLEAFLFEQTLQARSGIACAGVDRIDQRLAPSVLLLFADLDQLAFLGHQLQLIELSRHKGQGVACARVNYPFRPEAARRTGPKPGFRNSP